MNKLIGGIALVFLVVGGGPSAHADGPWCAFYDVSTYNCGFYSFEQCYENIRGAGGSCRPNIFRSNAGGAAGRRARDARPTQLTPADRRDCRYTGKPGSSRPNMSWKDARKCAIEQSADFLQPDRRWRVRPRRRSGACWSLHQPDRTIRAGGAPVRGEPVRRADGAAIDRRTARSPADACLDQTRRGTGESRIRGDLGARQASR